MSFEFSIVTPHLNQWDLLKRAVVSVSDQGVSYQHIIQDAGTIPPEIAWLNAYPQVVLKMEKDRGMYDALNKGFACSRGEIFGWLNADEQYLPGTLAKVKMVFEANPEIDILYGDSLIVDLNGTLLSFRKTTQWHLWEMIAPPLPLLSCSLFFRKKIWQRNIQFDDRWRDIADHIWLCECLRQGFRILHLQNFLATFTWTHQNSSASERSKRECIEYQKKNGFTAYGVGRRLVLLSRWLKKVLHGCYKTKDIDYAIYTKDSLKRISFHAKNPMWRWPS